MHAHAPMQYDSQHIFFLFISGLSILSPLYKALVMWYLNPSVFQIFHVCPQQISLIHSFAGQVDNSSVIVRGGRGLKRGFSFPSESKAAGLSAVFCVSLLETDVSSISY